MLQDNYGLYTDIESTCKHMVWLDLYIATCLEQYDYAPMANLCTLLYAWGQLLYDQTVSELHAYLKSPSYTHIPSFTTYVYTFLRFRICVKS